MDRQVTAHLNIYWEKLKMKVRYILVKKTDNLLNFDFLSI